MDFFGDKKRTLPPQTTINLQTTPNATGPQARNQLFSKTTTNPQMNQAKTGMIGGHQPNSQKDLMMLINQQVFSQTTSLSP